MKNSRLIQETLDGQLIPAITFAIATGLLPISGCSSANRIDKGHPTATVDHSSDLANGMKVLSPTLSFKGSSGDDHEEADVVLEAQIKPKNALTYHLLVKSAYEGHWRNYLRAVDESGRIFQGSATENHVSCELFCWFHDTVEITIPAEYLSSKQDNGITIYLVGPAVKSGLPLTLTPDYIKGFLGTLHL